MTNSLFISDDLFGFQVSYESEWIPSDLDDSGNDSGGFYSIELLSFVPILNGELMKFTRTGGEDCDILHVLTEAQKLAIIKRIHSEIINS